jgi:hemerythrin-like domain-containing protein
LAAENGWIEDRLFERIVRADGAAGADAARLRREHAELFAKGRAFCDAVREVENEVAMERAEFMGLADDFLAVQRAHRGFEEAVMFPFARRTLAEDDWREVADAARQVTASQTDPLFGALVRQEYERLKSAL